MTLRESPFSNPCARGLHCVAWALIFPCFWSLDCTVAVCKPTSYEKDQQEEECCLRPVKLSLSFLLHLLLMIAFTPLALLGFLLWAPLQNARRPFTYSQARTKTGGTQQQETWTGSAGGKGFGFVTANLCLLPESLARFNNLGHTKKRAEQIASRVLQTSQRPRLRVEVESPTSLAASVGSGSRSSLGPYPGPTLSLPPGLRHMDSSESSEASSPGPLPPPDAPLTASQPGAALAPQSAGSLPPPGALLTPSQPGAAPARRTACTEQPDPRDLPLGEITALFPPDVAFLCFQEVFDKRAAGLLRRHLEPCFPHTLSDVGVYAFQGGCSFKFLNSGMFVASRYPVLQANYTCFPSARGEDALAAKGLLCVKVLVGRSDRGQRIVGYFSCTHLHATAEDSAVRQQQLDEVVDCVQLFLSSSRGPEEKVVFDVICGDLNFDNCSQDDHLEQHHRLFNMYKDPCRARPGQDKSWVVGTLLEQASMYDEPVNTPENLQRTLENEETRRKYLALPITPGFSDHLELGAAGNGRRIDYLLYREETVDSDVTTEVEEFSFITQLAGLTDHLPVGMRLYVSIEKGES
ncbi:sphingomyelin phosphodiesterase 5 [Callorhinchus milii]|uniref:sphingomyelin phosphodiesterase n=1 Tax=Callorhinchus milii TaxID=7868 RepID=A0A4W3GQ11_CALMI|nr:sphingomyelin phosphodiesterase 5 [Callorhinchus milii]|eukprot:gi/632966468/ref/XP_007899432.1/ PREDICTED: sphingomyelin phosphodiesterase 3 [Callorhinchus milii]